MIRLVLRELRVHHYIKNLLVFLPAFFAKSFFCKEKIVPCVLGFASFCLLSSTVYIINDIADAKKDALHPVKKFRPIASGALSKKIAALLCAALYLAGFFLLALTKSPSAFFITIFYLALNVAYSFCLKNFPILDVAILCAGFVLRILLGSVLSDEKISHWLYLVAITASLCFALGKRRGEMTGEGVSARKVLLRYTKSFLDKQIYLCMTLLNAFYALWAMDASRGAGFLIWTFPLVLAITMKYSYNIEKNSSGDPIEVLFGDKALLVLCAIYCAAIFAILYVL